jgi:hypothetical protein
MHPLPYYGVHGEMDYHELDTDPDDWDLLREEGTDDNDVAVAQDHAQRNAILDGRYRGIRMLDWREQPITWMGETRPLGDISGGKLFHGSPYSIGEGEIIRPGMRGTNFKESQDDAISVTSHAHRAYYWAKEAGAETPHVYEVDPLYAVELHRMAPADYGKSFQMWEGRTKAARVVREVILTNDE